MSSTVGEHKLRDGSRIIIVGGGPAGSFFAIHSLKQKDCREKNFEIIIIDKNIEPKPQKTSLPLSWRDGCNYCAGGISPKLTEALERDGLVMPKEIIADKIESMTIHGHWKNIELRVPDRKKMYSVFRGSRPKGRVNKYRNFDSFLLEKAREAGAHVISGEVFDVRYLDERRLIVSYKHNQDNRQVWECVEGDFVVLAGGVNQIPGEPVENHPFLIAIQRIIPEFRPPRTRKALICEVEMRKDFERFLEGEVYFVEYGSKALKIEMSSLLPKRKYVTVVMLGKSIDRAKASQKLDLLRKYLLLPHISRILPQSIEKTFVCVCNPNMTVGAARNPFGDRIAVIGDMAVSRLYKDGIYSAHLMASSLARTISEGGVSRKNLKRGYWPVVKKIKLDNRFGKAVFILNHIVFSNPALSRILYQAVLTERKKKTKQSRRLADILWKIASGDDTYRASLISMFHPMAISSILVGGLLVTIRNYLAERIFGLRWKDFGRYPTGLHKEDFEEKKKEFIRMVFGNSSSAFHEFESMYSITIKSSRREIFQYLGTFGDEDRKYFRPRMIRVRRIAENPNRIGCELEYRTPFRFLDFNLVLENVIGEKYLIFRVKNGFAKGGILIFNIKKISSRVFTLYIYVAFNFAKEERFTKKMIGILIRYLFPGFIHDVLWNHSLCKLKDTIEVEKSRYS